MPRVNIHLQDIEDAEDLEEREDWELMVGLQPTDPRIDSLEARDRRRVARGSSEARDRRRQDRRKTVYRGGRRD